MKKDSKVKPERSKTGVPGLDDILSGLIPSELLAAIASVTGCYERIAHG
jgi:KaiC/GvpD/RAD55 family RecA-like ATPase